MIPKASKESVTPLLEFQDVSVSYLSRSGEVNIVRDVTFSVHAHEALGLVGESGSGKSTIAMAAVRFLGRGARIVHGRILFAGRDIATMNEAELQALRGPGIAMVYQDPMASLNPVVTIGRQLSEVPLLHGLQSRPEAQARAIEMLRAVHLPKPEEIYHRYPHQLSGGQQQRVVIAMALIANPAVLIMDEPTTGLDVTVEAAVLDLVVELRQKFGTAILFISHNLGTVAKVCDRVAVMYMGDIVEEGPSQSVLRAPQHPYTRGLLNCLPRLSSGKQDSVLVPIPGEIGSLTEDVDGCRFASRCEFAVADCFTGESVALETVPSGRRVRCRRLDVVGDWTRASSPRRDLMRYTTSDDIAIRVKNLNKVYGGKRSKMGAGVKALRDVSITLPAGKVLAIVGESGSGKSTLARIVSGLDTASSGEVLIEGVRVQGVETRPLDIRRRLQMVFQNPDSTLNPSHTIGYSISRAVMRLRGLPAGEAEAEMRRLLRTVKLQPELRSRRPHQLSGGQKQRVAIARALAGDPKIVIADEPVSALDVSVQASIINLLIELQAERNMTLLFISHDLPIVRFIADYVAVMYQGEVVEFGPVSEIFSPPFHPYTKVLLSSVSSPDLGDPETLPREQSGRPPSLN